MNEERMQPRDTTYTKVFVGGLAWETRDEELKKYFDQFGEISEAVVITEKSTGRSKGYGFVTFKEPQAATRACVVAAPVINGRKGNCNLAFLGLHKSKPSYLQRGRSCGETKSINGGVYLGGEATFHYPQFHPYYPLHHYSYGYPPSFIEKGYPATFRNFNSAAAAPFQIYPFYHYVHLGHSRYNLSIANFVHFSQPLGNTIPAASGTPLVGTATPYQPILIPWFAHSRASKQPLAGP